MAKVNLRVATLKHGNMKNCDLRGAVLAGADLEVIHTCPNTEPNIQINISIHVSLQFGNIFDSSFSIATCQVATYVRPI